MYTRALFSIGAVALAACGAGYGLIRPRRTWDDMSPEVAQFDLQSRQRLKPGESNVTLNGVGHWCDAPLGDAQAEERCREGHRFLRTKLERAGSGWVGGGDPIGGTSCREISPYPIEKSSSSPEWKAPSKFTRFVMICTRRSQFNDAGDFYGHGYPVVNEVLAAAGLSRDRVLSSSLLRDFPPEIEDVIKPPDPVDHLCIYLRLERCSASVQSCFGSSQGLNRLFCQSLANRE